MGRAGNVQVGKTTKPWELVVEAEAGEGLRGDLALDDFSLPPGCRFYDGPWHGENVTTQQPTPNTPETSSSGPMTTDGQSTPASTPPDIDEEEADSTSTGIIIGIVLGVLVLILAVTGFSYYRIRKRVNGDKTDGSAAAQFAAFTTPVGLERDVRNVQEFQMDEISGDRTALVGKAKTGKSKKREPGMENPLYGSS